MIAVNIVLQVIIQVEIIIKCHINLYGFHCFESTMWCYKNLDIRLFDKYIEEKAGPVIGVLEQNMYQGKFDWASCPQPTGKWQN